MSGFFCVSHCFAPASRNNRTTSGIDRNFLAVKNPMVYTVGKGNMEKARLRHETDTATGVPEYAKNILEGTIMQRRKHIGKDYSSPWRKYG